MFTKVYNLWRQAISKNSVTHEGYIPYFDGDNFPLKWAQAIANSPSATSCLSTISDFIEGSGFNDHELEKKVINKKGETFFQFHQKTVKEFSQNEGFFWLIRYNAAGAGTELEVLPFENCRLGRPDDNGYIGKIYYNPFFGTPEYKASDKKQTKVYDTFNPDAVRDQILRDGDKYKGQIFYFGTNTALSRFYPVHEAYAGIKWMKIEAGVADYHEDTIDNGFLNDFLLLMMGDPNAPSQNPDYLNQDNDHPVTVAEEFDQVMSENFMGKGKHANLMVQWVQNKEEKPEIIPFPSKANGDLFVTLDNQATKKITIAWKVPGILANIQEGVSLGGDANQIRVAVKLMQQRVIKKQRILTDNYQTVSKIMADPYSNDIEIVPYDPYPEDAVPDQKVWDVMTPDEKRQWIQDNTDIDLIKADTTQVDGAQPALPVKNFRNAVPIAFPDNVKSKVKKTLDYIDKMGIKCGGKSGREVADSIVNNTNMGYKQLKRIHSYLKKREHLATLPNSEGCDVIEYNSWGGKDMFDFLDAKLIELESWLN